MNPNAIVIMWSFSIGLVAAIAFSNAPWIMAIAVMAAIYALVGTMIS